MLSANTGSTRTAPEPGGHALVPRDLNAMAYAMTRSSAASPALNRKNFTPASRETKTSVKMMPRPRCVRKRKGTIAGRVGQAGRVSQVGLVSQGCRVGRYSFLPGLPDLPDLTDLTA